MVRLPNGWTFHPSAMSGPAARPKMTPIPRQSIFDFSHKVSGVPLQPSQAQGLISASGGLTLTIGPTGTGNTWYPAQVTVSTTTGVLDGSLFNLFVGPSGIPIQQVGNCLGGAGTIALAIPPMQPGLYLIGVWSQGHTGDLAAMNVIGVMDALADR